jgi:hypothetical protein
MARFVSPEGRVGWRCHVLTVVKLLPAVLRLGLAVRRRPGGWLGPEVNKDGDVRRGHKDGGPWDKDGEIRRVGSAREKVGSARLLSCGLDPTFSLFT